MYIKRILIDITGNGKCILNLYVLIGITGNGKCALRIMFVCRILNSRLVRRVGPCVYFFDECTNTHFEFTLNRCRFNVISYLAPPITP